ncbi:MAG: hypothetical protein DLM70_16145 [Chloroflexi bacterium]|nr:MAG: hypothetical protein DLM70_16145 [Chloroflexota bacterium]
MRLKNVATKFDASWLPDGAPEPRDVVKTLNYRKNLFGRPFSHALQDVMRGPSHWSVGDRELMAAFVSRQNKCAY